MEDYQDNQARSRRSGVLFGCLGIALVLILLGGGGVWWWVSSSFTQDPEKIAAILEEILPGAEAPEGYAGKFGMDAFGQKMVLLAGEARSNQEQLSGALIMVSATSVKEGADMEENFRRAIAQQSGTEDSKLEDLGSEAVTVGGVETPFQKSRVTTKDDKILLRYLGVLPARDGRVTTIMIMGPADHFDRTAMDAFLGSIPPSSAPRKR